MSKVTKVYPTSTRQSLVYLTISGLWSTHASVIDMDDVKRVLAWISIAAKHDVFQLDAPIQLPYSNYACSVARPCR